jgi:hypothetical protein
LKYFYISGFKNIKSIMNKSKIVVHLSGDLRMTPTPLDNCEYTGSKVYCYFEDFGTPVRTLVGYIENSSEYSGSLEIITSGDGNTLMACIHESAPTPLVQTQLPVLTQSML